MAEYDVIDRPAHYLEGRTIEPLEVIEDWDLDFHIGQVVKYCARAGRKDSELQDLEKARFYLDRKIEHLADNRVTVSTFEPVTINFTADDIDEDVLKVLFGDGLEGP